MGNEEMLSSNSQHQSSSSGIRPYSNSSPAVDDISYDLFFSIGKFCCCVLHISQMYESGGDKQLLTVL